ncbi:MAG: HAD family hydrolase [Clostridia bacterium]|nr:HAD family hydrolase [Clostridia bacterium]
MAYGLIFDLDGTLADTMDDLKTAVNATLTRLGYETRTKFELLNFINNGSRELIRRSLPTAVQTEDFIIDSAHNMFFEEYEKCFCEKTRAYPGIYDALVQLKQKKFKLGVLSNKPDPFVRVIVSTLFGENTFDFVMGKSDFPHKPDPSSALFVAKEMGVKPQKCIFVGDSDIDMFTAENADMRSIGVQWGYRSTDLLLSAGANYIAESPTEMIEHALECVRIIKMERKLSFSRKRKKAQNDETN